MGECVVMIWCGVSCTVEKILGQVMRYAVAQQLWQPNDWHTLVPGMVQIGTYSPVLGMWIGIIWFDVGHVSNGWSIVITIVLSFTSESWWTSFSMASWRMISHSLGGEREMRVVQCGIWWSDVVYGTCIFYSFGVLGLPNNVGCE